jgi:hypothetical protein
MRVAFDAQGMQFAIVVEVDTGAFSAGWDSG